MALKKDYAAIAASKIQRPSASGRKPRILVYSRNKKGKTTFCTSAGQEDTLIIDPEDGTEGMVRRDPHVWHIDEWSELDDAYQFLKLGKHQYKWVALDGLTRFSGMSLRFVRSLAEERDLTRTPGLVHQQDYGKAGELMKGMLNNFHSLRNMGVILTAQERVIETEGEDTEDEDFSSANVLYVPDLPKGVRSAANSIVDVIGRLYTVRIEHPKTGSMVVQRRLWLDPHEAYDTGYRSDYVLPPFVKGPTVPKLCSLLREGKVAR
ncbi:MAG: AAA family ATPase [Nitrospira sp.]